MSEMDTGRIYSTQGSGHVESDHKIFRLAYVESTVNNFLKYKQFIYVVSRNLTDRLTAVVNWHYEFTVIYFLNDVFLSINFFVHRKTKISRCL